MRCRANGIVAASLALAAMSSEVSAERLTYNDILGDWCDNNAKYSFTRDRLTMSFPTARAQMQVVRKIRRYDFSEEWVSVLFHPGGSLIFAEFSLDGRTMAQQPVEPGDTSVRREFRRC